MNKISRIMLTAAMLLAAAFAVLVIYDKAMSGRSDGQTRIYGSQADGESLSADEESKQDGAADNETGGIYDTSLISEAYLNKDPDSLSGIDSEIYDKASEVISGIITEDMSDFEKELAVHDWIVYNCTYDKKALGVLGGYSENSDNPYGVLYNGQAICKGYTSSFQMFMDMLEIPCLTVYASANGGEEHAWNMVKIENEWYYVDVTWDDPVPDYDGRLVVHDYFNVTEDFMRETGHEWDSSGLERADNDAYSYANGSVSEIHSYDELKNAASECLDGRREELYVVFAEDSEIVIEGYDGEYIDSTGSSKLDIGYLEPLIKDFSDVDIYCYVKEFSGGTGLEILFG